MPIDRGTVGTETVRVLTALRRFLLRTDAVVAVGQEDIVAAVEEGLNSLFGNV